MLSAVLETARIVAVLLAPVTPALSARIFSQLGLGEGERRNRIAAQSLADISHKGLLSPVMPALSASNFARLGLGEGACFLMRRQCAGGEAAAIAWCGCGVFPHLQRLGIGDDVRPHAAGWGDSERPDS